MTWEVKSLTAEEQDAFFEDVAKSDFYPVVNGEFKIAGQVSDQILLQDSFDFENEFGSNFYELADQIFAEDEDKSEALYQLGKECSQIGGYPFFTQEDPRMYTENPHHDTLLFQLASEDFDESRMAIMWGDCGVANFFINKQDLINRDFSNIMYNWDCS